MPGQEKDARGNAYNTAYNTGNFYTAYYTITKKAAHAIVSLFLTFLILQPYYKNFLFFETCKRNQQKIKAEILQHRQKLRFIPFPPPDGIRKSFYKNFVKNLETALDGEGFILYNETNVRKWQGLAFCSPCCFFFFLLSHWNEAFLNEKASPALPEGYVL